MGLFPPLLLILAAGCPLRRGEPPPAVPSPAFLQAWFLDVGQGDSTLVRTPGGKTLLVDGGRRKAGGAVLAALRERGIGRLDWVIGTHPHDDHIGGLIPVLEEVPAGQVIDSGFVTPSPVLAAYLRLIRERGYPFRRARPGTTLAVEPGVRLEFIAPPEPFLRDTESEANNNSVVFRLVYGQARFLFTGDMQDREREWIYRHGAVEWLPAEVLKVAHHGSHNGTDAAFLKRVRPRYAIISSGGEYGHPHREAVAALQQARVQVFRTDRLGTITVTSDGASVTVRPERAASAGETVGPVTGNRNSRIYHRPGCAALPGAANRVRFNSEAEALRQGYRPHAACVK